MYLILVVLMSFYKVQLTLHKYHQVIIGQSVYLDLKELIILKIPFGVMKQMVHQKEIMQSVVVTHQTLGMVS